jgi:D-alanine transaminase/branched-chain amino acid aminotransferase
MPTVFVGDGFIAADRAALQVSDLAIQRGYGIFDFFKTLGGKPIFLEDHLDRFFHSAGQMRLDIGKSRDELRVIIDELQRANGIPDSGIRITLTGGYSPDGYSLARPNLVITQQPLQVIVSEEMPRSMRLISWPHQRQMADVKTIDYLMAIWLQPQIRDSGADDVLYYRDGFISECPRSNFFIVTPNDTVVTPYRHILKGITRLKVLEIAASRYRVEQRDLHVDELKTAKEAFITSTTKQVVPVVQVDQQIIGGGASGEIARWLNGEVYRLARS